MKIGIVGTGMIGGTLAGLLTAAGHSVRVANRSGRAQLPGVEVVDVPATADGTDLVVLAIPFGGYRSLPPVFGASTVVDATNYNPRRDGLVERIETGQVTSSVLVAEHLGSPRVVKAFNTIYFDHLRTQGRPGTPVEERRALPISGDDAAAKDVVADLILELGFAPLDLGDLAGSRRQQPGSPLYNTDLTLAAARDRVTQP